MIDRLMGLVVEKEPTFVVLDVQGVGYGLHLSLKTAQKLNLNEKVVVQTFLAVKEDSLTLYGFAEKGEKQIFCSLIEVNGIGPKMAQRILSEADPQDIAHWVQTENVLQLTKLKGIGKKTAELLVLQLKGKLSKIKLDNDYSHLTREEDDAIQALISLGLKDVQARKAVEKAKQNIGSADVTVLITEALKYA